LIIYCDFDGILCTQNKDNPSNYEYAEPIEENIEKLNKLYEDGNIIIIWTSRGSITGIDYYDLTMKQIQDWGIKYHDLRLDKPYYDILIDDRSENSL